MTKIYLLALALCVIVLSKTNAQQWLTEGEHIYHVNEGSVVIGVKENKLLSSSNGTGSNLQANIISQPFSLKNDEQLSGIEFWLAGVSLPAPTLSVSIVGIENEVKGNCHSGTTLWQQSVSGYSTHVQVAVDNLTIPKGTYSLQISTNNVSSSIPFVLSTDTKDGVFYNTNCNPAGFALKHKILAKADISTRANPQGSLHVAGDIYTENGLKFNDGTVQNSAAYNIWSQQGSAAYYNGNIGIGIRTPNTNLSVKGRVRGAYDDNETEYTELGHGGGHGYINTSGDGTLAFRHDGTTKMHLTDQGNLRVYGMIESADGGIKFPDGSIQETAVVPNSNEEVFIINHIGNRFYNLQAADYYRIEVGSATIQSIKGGYDGKKVRIDVVPSDSGTPPRAAISFENQGAGVIPTNRVEKPKDFGFENMAIGEGKALELTYDGTVARWRITGLFDDGELLQITNGSGIDGAYLTYFENGENKATNIYFDSQNSQTLVGFDNIENVSVPIQTDIAFDHAYANELISTTNRIQSNDDFMLEFHRNNANGDLGHATYQWNVGADGALTLFKKADDGDFEPEFKLDENKLGINGQLGAIEEFTLVGNFEDIWADYVFKEDYQLMPLDKLEKFVKANHHLPEIPTASEIQDEGIKFSEISILYLKKIEELTLHVIELQKQIDELKEK